MAVLTYYVNADTGDDTTGNGSITTPWKTLPKFMSSADWAGSTGLICNVAGTHTLTATLNATNPNNYLIPWVITGSGKIIIDHTSSAGLVNDWGYRRLRVEVNVELKNSAPLFAGNGEFAGATIEYSRNAAYCTFRADQTIRNAVIKPLGNGVMFVEGSYSPKFLNCRFEGIRYLYTPAGTVPPYFERCIFYNGIPNFDVFAGGIGGTIIAPFIFRNCVFANVTGSGKTTLPGYYGAGSIDNCVFVDTAGTCLSGFFRDAEIYYYGMSPGSPTFLRSSSINSLNSDPYPNRASGDWTPSPELSAIVGSNGLTPGAVQAARAGLKPVNIRGGADQ